MPITTLFVSLGGAILNIWVITLTIVRSGLVSTLYILLEETLSDCGRFEKLLWFPMAKHVIGR